MVRPVALLCSEPLRPRMAGIGIRYFEMAKRLPESGFPVRLISPFRNEAERAEIEDLVGAAETVTYSEGAIDGALEGVRAVVAQGQLANEVVYQAPHLPLVVDLYDPWLVENLHYFESLGLDPYRNDHATWMLQLSAGDLFLCSSQEQALFYSGVLLACGRVNPIAMQTDPALERLLRVVPFGIPATIPEHRPVLPPRDGSVKRVLFGGLYDWYDPWPLLSAFKQLANERDAHQWRLLIVHNPNSGTPQSLVAQVKSWIKREKIGDSVEFLNWLPAERRYDLLRDVDVLAATHKDSLETRLSLRTRFLDALAVDCPILTTEGGALSRELQSRNAGWVVPESDSAAVKAALVEIVENQSARDLKLKAAGDLRAEFDWDRVLKPLVQYLESPWVDETKREFSRRPETQSPDDGWGFRVRRKLRRVLKGSDS